MPSKLCGKCKLVLDESLFYSQGETKDGLQTRCKECARKNSQKHYYTIDKSKRIRWSRETVLKTKYGITLKEYNRMLRKQKGVCAICKRSQTQKSNPKGRVDSLCVDHCHKTGVVRGLLCSNCNFGIAQFQDKMSIMLSAIAYIHNTKRAKNE